jgi:hypothetical protein
MSDPLQQDQEDIFSRLSGDATFSDVSVLLERRGVTESDIEIALSVLNTKAGKIGACAVVLMPTLQPNEPDAPGPEYFVEIGVQVISQALFNASAGGGTGKTAEDLALRVRQLLHRFDGGLGAWSFARMEPILGDPGKVTYAVLFRRTAQDEALPKAPLPLIEPEGGATPASVTLAAGDADAIWYTTNGSYPSPSNATATLYTVAIAIATPAILRAVAYKTNRQASNVASARFA